MIILHSLPPSPRMSLVFQLQCMCDKIEIQYMHPTKNSAFTNISLKHIYILYVHFHCCTHASQHLCSVVQKQHSFQAATVTAGALDLQRAA